MSPTPPDVRRIGNGITFLIMGLVIAQASFGFAVRLNKVLNSYPSVSHEEWAILFLLLMLVILGVDFLFWTTVLGRTFKSWNIVLNFLSAILTLLLVQIVANEAFEIESGVYPVAVLGILIPLVYYGNFGYLMKDLDRRLVSLKRQINLVIMIFSAALLLLAIFRVFQIGSLFLFIVVIVLPVVAVYVLLGWRVLLSL